MSTLSFTPPKPVKLNGSRVWYFRLRVPKDLMMNYAPRTEFKFSLHTENRKEAQSRILLKAQQLEQEFCEQRRRNTVNQSPHGLSPKAADALPVTNLNGIPFTDVSEVKLDRLVLLYPHDALKEDEAEHRTLLPDMEEAKRVWEEEQTFLKELHEKKGLSYQLQPFRKRIGLSEESRKKKLQYASLFVGSAQSFLSDGETYVIYSVADSYLERHQIIPPTLEAKDTSEKYQKFCLELMLQELTVQKAILSRLHGEWIDTPTVPGAGQATSSSMKPTAQQFMPSVQDKPDTSANQNLIPSEDNPPFSAVWQKYLDERKPTAGTVRTFRAAIRRFIEFVGDLPIKALTKSHIRQYKDTLAKTPVNLPRSMDAAAWPEVLKWVDAQIAAGKEVTFISPRTINEGRLVALNTVFTYIVGFCCWVCTPERELKNLPTSILKTYRNVKG